MPTPRDLCQLALKLAGALGVGQTPLAEDINDAFTMLNMMMGQWSQKRWLVYHLIDMSIPATGVPSYTIGAGGDFNTARPDRIESAFARTNANTPFPLDYPLMVIEAREDWNQIVLKNSPGMPAAIFYDSGFPLGTVYVTPVASPGYELHLQFKQPLASFPNLSTPISLPDEYQEAILYNLATRLFAIYGLPVRSDVVALAKAALNTVRNSNTQIATLKMPAGMPGVWRGNGYGTFGFGAGQPVIIVTPPDIIYPDMVLDEGALDECVLGEDLVGIWDSSFWGQALWSF